MILSALAGALALAMILLVLLRVSADSTTGRGHIGANATRTDGTGAVNKTGPRPGACTLCGSVLSAGETMRSDMLPGRGDRLMRIYGCPHCLGSEGERAARRCPVCSAVLGPADHAIARYFERPGRKHVHILGCTICRKRQGR